MVLTMKEEVGFVLYSTPDSVGRSAISLLAIGETIAAVILVWTLSILLNSTLPLLTSICFAPLLLLRSEESVELGLAWFYKYVDSSIVSLTYAQASPLKSIRFWGSVILAVVVDGITTFALLGFLARYPTDSIALDLVLAIVVGYLGLVMALIFVAAFSARELVVAGIRRDAAIAITISLLIDTATSGLLSRASFLVVFTIMATSLTLAVTVIFYAPRLFAAAQVLAQEEGQGNTDGLVIVRTVLGEVPRFFAFVRYGIYLGGWLRTIAIRFSATALHPLLGLRSLPENWKRTLFIQDFKSFPEVVPGYDREDLLNPEFVWKQRETYLRSLKYWIFFLVILVPPFFYRLSIRSTLWISWSLAYVNSDPEISQYPRYLHEKLNVSRFELFSRIVAVISLVIFLVPLIISAGSNSISDVLKSVAVSPLGLLFIVDLHDLVLVQVINLVGAVVTIAIWLSMKDFEAKIKHADDYPSIAEKMNSHARLVEIGLRLRNVTSIVFYFLFLVHAVLWLHPALEGRLPPFLVWLLTMLYGHKLPVSV